MSTRFLNFRRKLRSFWNKGQYLVVILLVVLVAFGAWHCFKHLPMFERVRYAMDVYRDKPIAAYDVYMNDDLLGTVENYEDVATAWNNAIRRVNTGVITYKIDADYTVKPTVKAPSELQSQLELQNNIKFYLHDLMKDYTNSAIALTIGGRPAILKDMDTVYMVFTELGRSVFEGTEHTVQCIGFKNGQPIYLLDDATQPYVYDGVLPLEEESGKTLIGPAINEEITLQTLYVMPEDIISKEEALALFEGVSVCRAYRVIHKVDVALEPTFVDSSALDIGQTSLLSAGTPAKVLRDDIIYYTVSGSKETAVNTTTQSEQTVKNGIAPVYYQGTRVPVAFIWPVSNFVITSYYGYRAEFGSFHSGLDLAGRKYSYVRAAADGVVTRAGRYTNMGNVIVINHGNGFATWYAHNAGGATIDDWTTTADLNDEANGYGLLVHVGDYVYQGQIIAYMGSSGFSTGPHCHFEITYNGRNVNPLDYLP